MKSKAKLEVPQKVFLGGSDKALSLDEQTDYMEGLNLLYVEKAKQRVYTMCTENICRILRVHKVSIAGLRYDEFRNLYEIKFISKDWRAIDDQDAVTIQTKISIQYEFFQKVGKEMVRDAIVQVANENTYDSAKDYIKAIKWDETPRLESWLTQTYGVSEDIYHKAVGPIWLKGLVKRIVDPGCKFDYVLVLEGEQGSKKSTSLSILGRDWHVETTMGTENKDFFMQFQGKAIIEFSEGETLSRTEVKRMKAIITTQVDTFRPPYGRVTKDFPRRCVFAMTTNQNEYLKDETGNRRWLPVTLQLPQANIEWLKENRDQLLAEAYHRVVVLEEDVYNLPQQETIFQQSLRRVLDPNSDRIVNWYFNDLTDAHREAGITTEQVYKDCLNNGFTSRPKSRADDMSIASVLREVLKLEKKQVMIEYVRMYRYYETNATVLAGVTGKF